MKNLVAPKDKLKEIQTKMGIAMRSASFFEFSPVDADKGVFEFAVSIAGKKFFKATTKVEKDALVLDKYNVDETELNAAIEWLEGVYADLVAGKEIKNKKNENYDKDIVNTALAEGLVELTKLGG